MIEPPARIRTKKAPTMVATIAQPQTRSGNRIAFGNIVWTGSVIR